MKNQTFYSWLKRQACRDDPVGDLARDAKRDPNYPERRRTYNGWLKYLCQQGACQRTIDAFKRAWGEWTEQK